MFWTGFWTGVAVGAVALFLLMLIYSLMTISKSSEEAAERIFRSLNGGQRVIDMAPREERELEKTE